ncbi:YifB family Mg chelatase-like AAA ATPase [Corynebacterium lubricantis]|uniref:YifB family Mg chelatase-like AAA ATPase n=1 Tax=Corynebacterium lubricantis TaxID=541095 RepID=UPI00037718B3|nr:YifB family Mg chelatase-like AAA ATPase [Corynebacterium lubricantis]
MALASTSAATVEGVVAFPVTVEANVGPGLPGMYIVGLGDATVRESRDRIKTAIANSRLPWPKTKIMVSLSPAHLPKSGSHFDLPVALAVLGSLHPGAAHRLETTLLAGELGLDGSLRPVDGILPIVASASADPERTIIIPAGNAAEAALVGQRNILVARSLNDVWNWAIGNEQLPAATDFGHFEEVDRGGPDFADIAGQSEVKKALEVAAAGAHHVLMVGPPGSGKSMLAQRIPSILPPLTPQEIVEATAVHSVSGRETHAVIRRAPYIAPHPALTRAALIGGGSGRARPGAVSLAHRGVLFLDEVSEVPAAVLDNLRTPLEEGCVRLSRARREVQFPARFQLIMAANPCRCGAEDALRCRCSSREKRGHLSNVSGPLRDRIDITVATRASGAVIADDTTETSATIAHRVEEARDRARARWSRAGLNMQTNSEVEAPYLRRHYPADDAGMALLGAYLAQGDLSQRGVDRAIKLAWTLCDLEGGTRPNLDHVASALDLRTTVNAGRVE